MIKFVNDRYTYLCFTIPDSKVHGAHMGPTWGRQDPGGPHVGHVNLVIWDMLVIKYALMDQLDRRHDDAMTGKCFPHYWSFVLVPGIIPLVSVRVLNSFSGSLADQLITEKN